MSGKKQTRGFAGAVVLLTLMLPAVSSAVTDEEIGQQVRATCSRLGPVEGVVAFGEFTTASEEARSLSAGAFANASGAVRWLKIEKTSATITVACDSVLTTVTWERNNGKNASMVLDGPRDPKKWISESFPIENGYCLYGHLLGEYKFQPESRVEVVDGVLRGVAGVTQVVTLHYLGDETIDGHPCWKLEAVWPGNSDRTFLWLGSDMGGVIVRRERRNEEGRLLSVLENLAFQVVGGVVIPKETDIQSFGGNGERTTLALLVECNPTTLENLWAKACAPLPDNTKVYDMIWGSVYLRKSGK